MTDHTHPDAQRTGPTLDAGVLDVEHAHGQAERATVAGTATRVPSGQELSAQTDSDSALPKSSRRNEEAVSGGGQRRRRRGPLRMLRFRAGLVVRRWRQSLQFRAVSIAMIGAFVIFLVTGAFLSHQISERLFNDRLEQVLTQSETDFTQVQASFDASDAADRDQLQTLVSATLDSLDSDPSNNQRRWLLIPMSSDTGQSMLPAQAESDWMTSATVPEDLQNRVEADASTYWQSASVQMDEGANQVPVVIVGRVVEPQPGARYGLYLVNDFSQPQQTLDAIHAVLILSTMVQALLVSGVVGYVTREVVRPVSTTARVSESLADGNLGVRMEVEGSHEVARLGRSFNRMADNLEDQITRLERLSSMQQTFVSDVSHELRTPLTTVRMAAEVLHNARDEFDPVNRRSAELLYNQVDRFDTLLADLLEISRFDAGAARLDISGINIFALVNEVLEATAPLAANSHTVVRVHSDLQRCIVQMDQRRIDRILRNLLVNALEHGEGRPVDVVVRASEVAVGIAVRDHGIGMTQEHTQKVFDRFWRADPARARTTGGTGLGLSIAVEDTRLHGGRLDAWGAPGEGACFRLTLPLLRSQPLTEEDLSPVDLPPVVDELPSVAVVTDTGTFAAVPLDRDSVMAPVTESLPKVGPADPDLPGDSEGASVGSDNADDADKADKADDADKVGKADNAGNADGPQAEQPRDSAARSGSPEAGQPSGPAGSPGVPESVGRPQQGPSPDGSGPRDAQRHDGQAVSVGTAPGSIDVPVGLAYDGDAHLGQSRAVSGTSGPVRAGDVAAGAAEAARGATGTWHGRTDTGPVISGAASDGNEAQAPAAEERSVIESRAAAGLDGPAARGPVLRPAIGGDFLEATEVSDQAVDAAAPSDTPGHTGSSGATPLQGAGVQAPDVQPEEFDDLDEAYEDLYVDDTGELPPFRDRGPQSPSGGRQ